MLRRVADIATAAQFTGKPADDRQAQAAMAVACARRIEAHERLLRIFELRGPMMVRNRYDEPTMKVALWQKDMQVIGEFANALGCPTPLFRATQPIYDAALAAGHGPHDTASVCAVLEARAGVKRKKAKNNRTSPRK